MDRGLLRGEHERPDDLERVERQLGHLSRGTTGVAGHAAPYGNARGTAGDGGASVITVLTDGSALIDGLALTTDVNVQFGLQIDEALYDTIGGYVLGRLGRRPRLGDVVDVGGRKIRVEALDGLRVARVLVSTPS